MFFPLRDDAPRRHFPWMNWVLIGLNAVVFLYELELPSRYLERVVFPTLGLVPYRVNLFVHGTPIGLAAVIVPVFTSMFLHGGWWHLIGNMWMLYLFGDNVEDLLGHGRYLAFYLGCGVIAAMTQVAADPHSLVPTIGASGAIAGVLGAYFIRYPRARVLTLVFLLVFFTFWELPAWIILGAWFLIQFLSGASALAHPAAGGVAWFAHLGGFIAGMLAIWLVTPRTRYARG